MASPTKKRRQSLSRRSGRRNQNTQHLQQRTCRFASAWPFPFFVSFSCPFFFAPKRSAASFYSFSFHNLAANAIFASLSRVVSILGAARIQQGRDTSPPPQGQQTRLLQPFHRRFCPFFCCCFFLSSIIDISFSFSLSLSPTTIDTSPSTPRMSVSTAASLCLVV